MKRVAYYITGHGFGHATRSIELIRGLLVSSLYHVTIISSLQPNFFLFELQEFTDILSIRRETLDTGGIQIDAIVLDPYRTLEAYHDLIHVQRRKLIEHEVEWLKRNEVSIVLVDSTPLACIAGKTAGCKTVLVSNLTWSYIFSEMLHDLQSLNNTNESSYSTESLQKFQDMILQCSVDSVACSHVIRLPGFTPDLENTTEERKILQAPLIHRPIKNKNFRNELGIPSDQKLLLLGFGGHASEWNLRDSYLPVGWQCLVLRAEEKDLPSERFKALPEDSYVPDLIFAADVVLGKIGYGFVSECVGAGTPLVYVPRVHWAEEPFLEKFLAEKSAGLAMPLMDFKSGSWASYLEEASKRRRGWVLEESLLPPRGATATIVDLVNQIAAE